MKIAKEVNGFTIHVLDSHQRPDLKGSGTVQHANNYHIDYNYGMRMICTCIRIYQTDQLFSTLHNGLQRYKTNGEDRDVIVNS
ncbi:hypothetical protein HAX54_026523 [Datura stramonium]|uniref:Uncharacterized protein n=1 Tax=Datura stramonium TaxID=4076 RepID=A0ABS8S7W9_DATST|nr:hypothetical protein [Datura stramonium]